MERTNIADNYILLISQILAFQSPRLSLVHYKGRL